MLKNIFKHFEEPTKIVIYYEDPSIGVSFIDSIDYHETKVEQIARPGFVIMTLTMKYNEYLKFMNRLNKNGLNLKQEKPDNSICVVIRLKKSDPS